MDRNCAICGRVAKRLCFLNGEIVCEECFKSGQAGEGPTCLH